MELTPKISVVVATMNPQPEVIRWALDSLRNQTLPKSEFEVVVVDNNSTPPLDEASLSAELHLRVIREPRPGTTFARCTGIRAAAGDLIVFLDDDNHFDPNYLEESLRIAAACPKIGAFSGISRILCEGSIAEWKRLLLPYLAVRDYGPEVITSDEDRWGPWEPIGAGMVFRRELGTEFVRVIETEPLARLLGRRTGKSFICGEDTLVARMAYRLGYSCSYQPSLKLTHMIKSNRLTPIHLARLIEGIGRAFVIYETLLGRPQPGQKVLRELAGRLRARMQTKGAKAGFIEWFWDVGYFKQVRLLRRRAAEGRNEAEVLHRHSEL